MRATRLVWVLAAFVIAAPATAEQAPTPDDRPVDQFWLDDQSRIVGRLVTFRDRRVVVETTFAGTVELDATTLAGITTAEPWVIELETGERVAGRLLYQPDTATQRVQSDSLGDIRLDDPIFAMWPVGHATPEAARIERIRQQHAEQAQRLEETQPSLGANWTARIELGLAGATGNTERIGFQGRARARRETDFDRVMLHVGGQYAKEGGTETENQVFGGAGLEVDITDRIFTFLRAELERDDFEQLELRTTVTGGLGAFVIREDEQELKLRGGAGFQHEVFRDGFTDSNVVLELGLDYRLDILEWLRFTHSSTLFPTVDDPFSDYRAVAETAGEIPIAGDTGLRIRAGMRNRYNAMPRPGVRRLDTTYFLNLVYDWN